MKRFLVILCAAALVFGTVGISNAALIGDGTVDGDGVVFDNISLVSWLEDGSSNFLADPIFWEAADNIALGLTYNAWDNWRLPTLAEAQSMLGSNPTAYFSAIQSGGDNGWYWTNSVDHINTWYQLDDDSVVLSTDYTSGIIVDQWEDYYHSVFSVTEGSGTDYKFAYQLYAGDKYSGDYLADYAFITDTASFWAVSDNGPVGPPIPEPTTMLLLGTGMIGLAGIRRKMKK